MLCDIVLVAAGTGSRFQGQTPKQFELLHGQPLYSWSLNTFLNWPECRKVCLVVPTDWVDPVKESFKNFSSSDRLIVVEGGKTRQESAHRGVLAVGDECEWIMVHDAARPAVSQGLIDRVWEARRFGDASSSVAGVIPGIPVTETIKSIEVQLNSAVVSETLKREALRVIQTPQLLKREILIEAYEAFNNSASVDDASLVEKLGYKIVIVDGDNDNVKVTFAEDKSRVENWLRDRHPSF